MYVYIYIKEFCYFITYLVVCPIITVILLFRMYIRDSALRRIKTLFHDLMKGVNAFTFSKLVSIINRKILAYCLLVGEVGLVLALHNAQVRYRTVINRQSKGLRMNVYILLLVKFLKVYCCLMFN